MPAIPARRNEGNNMNRNPDKDKVIGVASIYRSKTSYGNWAFDVYRVDSEQREYKTTQYAFTKRCALELQSELAQQVAA